MNENELPTKVTFTYAADLELGPQPEDVSVHFLDLQSAKNLVAYNLDNKGLASVLIEIGVTDGWED